MPVICLKAMRYDEDFQQDCLTRYAAWPGRKLRRGDTVDQEDSSDEIKEEAKPVKLDTKRKRGETSKSAALVKLDEEQDSDSAPGPSRRKRRVAP